MDNYLLIIWGNSTSLNGFFKLIVLSETTFVCKTVIIIGSPYQMNTHYQKPLPGKLVCALIKLAVIKDFTLNFQTRTNMISKLWRRCPNRHLSVFSVICNICGYIKRLARNLFPRPVRLTVRVNLRGIILVWFHPLDLSINRAPDYIYLCKSSLP